MMIPHVPHDDSAKYYPNTPTGHPHVPAGLIAGLVLIALVVLIVVMSRSRPRDDDGLSARDLAKKRSGKR
jgi:hypothetical protein